MKQTTVEWYAVQAMQLEIQRGKGIITISQMLNELSNILEQAKAMEKEQMRTASCPYIGGWEEGEFEDWYNETYNKDESNIRI
jgi:hypothetical protein